MSINRLPDLKKAKGEKTKRRVVFREGAEFYLRAINISRLHLYSGVPSILR